MKEEQIKRYGGVTGVQKHPVVGGNPRMALATNYRFLAINDAHWTADRKQA
jgi:prophage maintenance system killer protein